MSRWFIVNSSRARGGQFTLSLYRDLVADFYSKVITAPSYIERAMVDIGNPFIWNSENITFNQIKTKEVLLKDETQSGWYVGYVSADTGATTITTPSAEGNSFPAPPIDYNTIVSFGNTFNLLPQEYTVAVKANIGGSSGAGKHRELVASTLNILLNSADYEGTLPTTSYIFDPNRAPSRDGAEFLAGIKEVSVNLRQALQADFPTRVSG